MSAKVPEDRDLPESAHHPTMPGARWGMRNTHRGGNEQQRCGTAPLLIPCNQTHGPVAIGLIASKPHLALDATFLEATAFLAGAVALAAAFLAAAALPATAALSVAPAVKRGTVTDGTATAKALDYSLRRWGALTRFLNDAQLPVDSKRPVNPS